MARDKVSRLIPGEDGKDCKWDCTQHPGSEGFDLLLDVTETFIEPLAHLSGSVPVLDAGGLVFNLLKWSSGEMPDPSLVSEQLQLSSEAVAASLRALVGNLTKNGKSDLMKAILRYTWKTGTHPVSGEEGKRFNVSEDAIYDEVFAGNIFELFNAVKFAVEVNWMPFTQEDVAQARGSFLQAMTVASQESSKTET